MIYRDPAYSEKAINAFAFKVSRRLFTAGDRSMSMDDIRQELWIAWCIAVQSFNEAQGVPFLAYLRNGMRLHINRFVEKNVTRRHEEVVAYSLDGSTDDENGSVSNSSHDHIPSADPMPDEGIQQRSSVNALCGRLSPIASQFVRLLYEQPEPLLREVYAIKCKADFASSMNMVVMNSGRLTRSMLFDLLGVPHVKRKSIIEEIEEVVGKLSKVEAL